MNKIIDKMDGKCDSCETYTVSSESTSVSYENGKLKSCSTKESGGTALRYVLNGKMCPCIAAGEELEDKLVDSGLSMAAFGSNSYFEFPGKAEYSDLQLYKDEEANSSIDDMVSLGSKLVNRISENWPDLVCGASVSSGKEGVAIETSNGFDGSFKSSSYGFGVSVESSKKGDIFSWGHSLNKIPDENDLEEFFEYSNKTIELGLNIAHLDAGNYPVILAPNSLPFLLRALEEGVKGSNIFYKKSPLLDRLDEKVLSDLITIIDDPGFDRLSKTLPFDDEGVVATKHDVFENGVFKKILTDLEFAARLSITPSGHGRRQGHIYRDRQLTSAVSIGAGNWRIASGDRTLDELMADIKCGVYIDSSFDCWMGNIVSGDFSGTLHRAYKIENGKLTGRIKHRAFSGNIYDVLGKQLKAIGSKLEIVDKGFGSVEAPHLLVDDMNIS